MKYKKLGNSDLMVSVVGLGTWAMGNDFWGEVDDSASINTIQKAIDCGVNLIDTAPAYGKGHAEIIVGKAIKGKRDKVVIATKCGIIPGGEKVRNLKPQSIRNELHESLKRLNTDYIDLYQIHWPDEDTPIEETLEEMMKFQKEGKVKYIGVSNFDIELLSRSMEIAPITSIQPQFSLLSRENEQIIEFCRMHGIGVLSYGSLGAGMLSGKFTGKPEFNKGDNRSRFYPFFNEPMLSKALRLVDELRKIAAKYDKPVSHIAINWVVQHEAISSALVGAKTPKQAEENALAGYWELAAEDISQIDRAYDEIFA